MRHRGRAGNGSWRRPAGALVVLAAIALSTSCGTDPPSASGAPPGPLVTAGPAGPTGTAAAPTEAERTERPRRTSTTASTTTTMAPDPASVRLEPLLLPADSSGAPTSRTDAPLRATELAARPLLSSFDQPVEPPPDPDLVLALERAGFEGAIRGTAITRSYPSVWTITIARFATTDGASGSAAALTGRLASTPGAVAGGTVAAIPSSTLVSVPSPTGVNGPPTMIAAVFTVDRDLVTIITHEHWGPLADSSFVARLATQQHARLVEAAASGGP